MRFDWRVICGPALTSAMAAAAATVDGGARLFDTLSPLLVFCVAAAGALGGIGAGFVSAAIAVGIATMVLPDMAGRALHLAALALATGAAALVTGGLRPHITNAKSWQRRRYATAERLSAALDRIDIGVVLLDADTRAEFINRAFRDYFALSDAKADEKPPFVALMYHGRDVGAYQIGDEDIGDYIAERTERVRSGDPTPIQLTLADGRVLRSRCTALPDGGRMLSYAPIDDALRRGDDPARRDYYLSLRAGGPRSFRILPRAAE